MSTATGKCHGCGEGEAHVSSGVIAYVCGTTLSQFGTNRSTTCHGIEAATLRRRITELQERVARLEEALGCVIPTCNHLHHDKRHQHKPNERCPVELLVMRAKEEKP